MSDGQQIGNVNHCWSCGSALADSALLCSACRKLQPTAGVDYFRAFGLERKLAVDGAQLERAFHRLSRQLHPDRFARSSVEEQQRSLESTALLNDAYRTLREPVGRVEYLLGLERPDSTKVERDQEKSMQRQPPADLLEEVFELNMQLEEMRMNRKAGESDPVLEKDLEAARVRFDQLMKVVDEELLKSSSQYDEGGPEVRDDALTAMAALLDRRRYLRNLVRDVNEALAA